VESKRGRHHRGPDIMPDDGEEYADDETPPRPGKRKGRSDQEEEEEGGRRSKRRRVERQDKGAPSSSSRNRKTKKKKTEVRGGGGGDDQEEDEDDAKKKSGKGSKKKGSKTTAEVVYRNTGVSFTQQISIKCLSKFVMQPKISVDCSISFDDIFPCRISYTNAEVDATANFYISHQNKGAEEVSQ